MAVDVVTLTEANNGQAIELRQGDAVDLRLHENPTTGFRWQVVRADGLVEEPARTRHGPRARRSCSLRWESEAFGRFDFARARLGLDAWS